MQTFPICSMFGSDLLLNILFWQDASNSIYDFLKSIKKRGYWTETKWKLLHPKVSFLLLLPWQKKILKDHIKSIMIRVNFHNAFFHNQGEVIKKIRGNVSQKLLNNLYFMFTFFLMSEMFEQTRSNWSKSLALLLGTLSTPHIYVLQIILGLSMSLLCISLTGLPSKCYCL